MLLEQKSHAQERVGMKMNKEKAEWMQESEQEKVIRQTKVVANEEVAGANKQLYKLRNQGKVMKNLLQTGDKLAAKASKTNQQTQLT